MFAGNLSAQVITLFMAPVVTRLYEPDAFGVMTVIWALIGIFGGIACMRYDIAIVISGDEQEADSLFYLCGIITFGVSLLLFIVCFAGKDFFCRFLTDKRIISYVWFVPAGVFISGNFQIISNMNVRMKKFNLISLGRILSACSTAGIKIIAGLLGAGSAFWLISGNIAGQLSTAILLAFSLYYFRFGKNFFKFKFSDVWDVAKKYSDFPKYRALTGLINSLTQNLPVLLFGFLFSDVVVGFYGLTNAVLRRPVTLISQSISKVFLQKASEIQKDNKALAKAMIKTTLGLSAIGLLPFGVLMAFGGWIFSTAFGSKWCIAGSYAQVLAPWFFMLLINTPATQVILVKQKLKFNLYFNIVYICLRLLVILAGYFFTHNSLITIGLFSASGVLANLFLIYYAYNLTRCVE